MSRPVGSTKYHVNDDFFCQPNKINSYWAGFLAADGALTPYRNNVRLGISIKDEKHLERLRHDVGFNGPIRYSNDLCILEVYSRTWRQSLKENFYVTPQKSLTLKPPVHLNHECSMAYIAGYIDGDGWRTQSRNTPAIGFQGTETVTCWIAGFLNTHFPATRKDTSPSKRSDANCWQATIYGARVIELTQSIKTLELPLLERKWHE